jgi:uncharacterized repeat protein (TIGR04138 family)
MSELIRSIARSDGRYRRAAFVFLFEALEPAIALTQRPGDNPAQRHLTGQELLQGLCSEATRMFGPLAAHVWRTWGVKEPLDWGQIVFLLVEHQLLSRRESDTLDDFRIEIDFEDLFVNQYQLDLPGEVGPTGPGETK